MKNLLGLSVTLLVVIGLVSCSTDEKASVTKLYDNFSAESDTPIRNIIVSGPFFGLLRRYDKSFDLAEIDLVVSEQLQKEPARVIDRVAEFARRHDVHLSTVQLADRDHSAVPIPCLLVTSRQGKAGDAIQLLLVEAVGETSLQVYDFEDGKGRSILPAESLPLIWFGDCIVASKSQDRTAIYSIPVIILGVLALLAVTFRKSQRE